MRSIAATMILSAGLAADCGAAEITVESGLSEFAPLVIDAGAVPVLAGRHPRDLYCYRFTADAWQPVACQIDFRDSRGDYDFSDHPGAINDNEQLVFMPSDLGAQAPADDDFLDGHPHTALSIRDRHHAPAGWLYVLTDTQNRLRRAATHYVHYDAVEDVITGADYRIGFSSTRPMLVDSLQWRDQETSDFGVDVLDTMQLIHTGDFLHALPFRRTQKDYSSTITGVIHGPVRVIRRTENHVRVVWQLKAPAVTIDYIASARAVLMDTVLDLPFSPKWFFSDVDTWSTLDWNPNSGAQLLHSSLAAPVAFNGRRDHELTAAGATDTRIGTTTEGGTLFFTMRLPEGMPVEKYVHVEDDHNAEDSFGEVPGHFGNVGFLTRHWERLERGRHHFVVKAVLAQPGDAASAFEWLGQP